MIGELVHYSAFLAYSGDIPPGQPRIKLLTLNLKAALSLDIETKWTRISQAGELVQ